MRFRAFAGAAVSTALFVLVVVASIAFAQLIPRVALVSSEIGMPSDEVTLAVERRIDLSTPANLELQWSDPTKLETPAGVDGFVTALVEPEQATCGSVVAHVNDQPIVALCSPFPLWRDLSSRSNGVDADVIAAMLVDSNHLTSSDADRSTVRRAIREWQSEIGVPVDGVIEPSTFLWFGAEVEPFEWSVNVGDSLANNPDLASAVSRITSATVAGDITASREGWFFELASGSPPIPVRSDGSIELAGSTLNTYLPEAARAEQLSELGGRLYLDQPILTTAVTATALVGDETGGWCVIRSDSLTGNLTPVGVQVIDSRLGSVFLQGEISPGDRILAFPGGQAC